MTARSTSTGRRRSRATSSTTATTAWWSAARPARARRPASRETGDILRAVKDAVGDRATVVAGVGTNATAHSIELAQQAEKLGADALLLVTPYYNKPGQAGVLHHFQQVVGGDRHAGDAVRRARPHGTQISLETYERIKGDTVVAVKDAVGDFARGVELHARWATPSTAATTSPTSAGSRTAPAA